jgi:preprotein translocase subunit SecE
VAKTTPVEFFNQVKAETKKVVWPSWKETYMTGIMVVVMTTVLALFFLGVDSFFEAVVRGLLKLAQGR